MQVVKQVIQTLKSTVNISRKLVLTYRPFATKDPTIFSLLRLTCSAFGIDNFIEFFFLLLTRLNFFSFSVVRVPILPTALAVVTR